LRAREVGRSVERRRDERAPKKREKTRNGTATRRKAADRGRSLREGEIASFEEGE